jgi:hypothetical protein
MVRTLAQAEDTCACTDAKSGNGPPGSEGSAMGLGTPQEATAMQNAKFKMQETVARARSRAACDALILHFAF